MKLSENILNKIPGISGSYVNFYHAAYPVCTVSRTFGFLPFIIEFDANFKLKRIFVSSKDIIRVILALIVLAACVYASFLKEMILKHISAAVIYGTRLLVAAARPLAMFELIMDLINRKLLIKALVDIGEIDEQVFFS